jgi:L-lactate utilization protein LutB
MTLTATDIKKIQDLYQRLDALHAKRKEIKDVVLESMHGIAKQGTSGVRTIGFDGLSAEASKEICDIIARDLRRRAAKIVETLHKFGCEAQLTEEA